MYIATLQWETWGSVMYTPTRCCGLLSVIGHGAPAGLLVIGSLLAVGGLLAIGDVPR